MFLFLLSLACISTADDLYNCKDEAITLDMENTEYRWDSHRMAPSQKCTLNFTIPATYFAQIHIDGTSLAYLDLFDVYSKWTETDFQLIQGMGQSGVAAASASIDVSWPPQFFQIDVTTVENTSAIITIVVKVQPFNVKDSLKTLIKTGKNQQPEFIQMESWALNTTFEVQSISAGVSISTSAPAYTDNTPFANVFVYEGIGDQLEFRGTLYSLLKNAGKDTFFSKGNNLTLYRASTNNIVGTVIINDQENLKGVTYYTNDWSPYNQYDINQEQEHLIEAKGGLGVLTILNQEDGSNAIYVTKITYFSDDTAPLKLLAGGMLQDYMAMGTLLGTYGEDNQGLPQFLPGFARTFVLEKGRASVHYTTVQNNTKETEALNGRTGFIMSNNYPFSSKFQNSDDFVLESVNEDTFTFFYSINNQSSNPDAYLNITLWGENGVSVNEKSNHIIDLYNVTLPFSTNHTARGMVLTIAGGQDVSTGTLLPFSVISTSTTSVPASSLPTTAPSSLPTATPSSLPTATPSSGYNIGTTIITALVVIMIRM